MENEIIDPRIRYLIEAVKTLPEFLEKRKKAREEREAFVEKVFGNAVSQINPEIFRNLRPNRESTT